MSALQHACLIKGFLLAKEAPQEVMDAVEAIIASLGRASAQEVVTQGRPYGPITPPPQGERQVGLTDMPASGGHLQEGDQRALEPEQPKQRKSAGWTPERRAAAAERMRKMQANGGLRRGKKSSPDRKDGSQSDYANPSPDPASLRITVPKPRLKSRLTDADWPEIKEMLADGRSRESIAGDYDEETDDLDAFIAEQRDREGEPPGEAVASPSGEASDAARPKW